MTSICIFCGSSHGGRHIYADATRAVVASIAQAGLTIVYGGGKTGLMGIVAEEALARGASVIGIMPRHLFDREIAHTALTEFHVTQSMHERKAMMARKSDGFLVLPGGFGTLEELSEVLSWAQIGLHAKPVGFLNVDGYFDGLFGFFDTMTREGFLRQRGRDLVISDDEPDRLLARMSGRSSH